jgi:hypothetical protein
VHRRPPHDDDVHARINKDDHPLRSPAGDVDPDPAVVDLHPLDEAEQEISHTVHCGHCIDHRPLGDGLRLRSRRQIHHRAGPCRGIIGRYVVTGDKVMVRPGDLIGGDVRPDTGAQQVDDGVFERPAPNRRVGRQYRTHVPHEHVRGETGTGGHQAVEGAVQRVDVGGGALPGRPRARPECAVDLG